MWTSLVAVVAPRTDKIVKICLHVFEREKICYKVRIYTDCTYTERGLAIKGLRKNLIMTSSLTFLTL